MTVATLMGPPLSPVTILPPITHADFTFSISGPQGQTAQATVIGTTDGANWDQLLVMYIGPQSPTTVTAGTRFPAVYVMFDALLNQASSQAGNATVTMTY